MERLPAGPEKNLGFPRLTSARLRVLIWSAQMRLLCQSSVAKRKNLRLSSALGSCSTSSGSSAAASRSQSRLRESKRPPAHRRQQERRLEFDQTLLDQFVAGLR
jgi:hypothetical protein